MEMQPPSNPGQSAAVQAALARRGGSAAGQGALTQVSPGAPMQNPVPQPMNLSEMTQASAPSGSPTPQAPTAPKFQPQDRTDLITLALIEQMKNDNKLTKEQAKMGATPAPSEPLMPTEPAMTSPMGGGNEFSASWNQPTPSTSMPTSQKQSDYGSGMGRDYSGMSNYGTGKM